VVALDSKVSWHERYVVVGKARSQGAGRGRGLERIAVSIIITSVMIMDS